MIIGSIVGYQRIFLLYHIYVLLTIILIITGGGSCTSVDTIVNSDITGDTVWTVTESPYVIQNDIRVMKSKLTIEPGVQIHVQCGASIIIDELSSIEAIGEELNSILFSQTASTSCCKHQLYITNRSSPTQWSEQREYSAGSILKNVIFTGSSLLTVQNDLYISNSKFISSECNKNDDNQTTLNIDLQRRVVLEHVDIVDQSLSSRFHGLNEKSQLVFQHVNYRSDSSISTTIQLLGKLDVSIKKSQFSKLHSTTLENNNSTTRTWNESFILMDQFHGKIHITASQFQGIAYVCFISTDSTVLGTISDSIFDQSSVIYSQSETSQILLENSRVENSESVVYFESGELQVSNVVSSGQNVAYFLGNKSHAAMTNCTIDSVNTAIVSHGHFKLIESQVVNSYLTTVNDRLIEIYGGPVLFTRNQFIGNVIRQNIGMKGSLIRVMCTGANDDVDDGIRFEGNVYNNGEEMYDLYYDCPLGTSIYMQAIHEQWINHQSQDRIYDFNKDKSLGIVLLYEFEIIVGDIAQSTIWKSNRPYRVTDNITISKLTIEENTMVVVNCGVSIRVNGEMKVMGTDEKPVYIGTHGKCTTIVPMIEFHSTLSSTVIHDNEYQSGSIIQNTYLITDELTRTSGISLRETSLFISNSHIQSTLLSVDDFTNSLIELSGTTTMVTRQVTFSRARRAIDINNLQSGTITLLNCHFEDVQVGLFRNTNQLNHHCVTISVNECSFIRSSIAQLLQNSISPLNLSIKNSVIENMSTNNTTIPLLKGSGHLLFLNNEITSPATTEGIIWTERSNSSIISGNLFRNMNTIGSFQGLGLEFVGNYILYLSGTTTTIATTSTTNIDVDRLLMASNVFKSSIFQFHLITINVRRYESTSKIINNDFLGNSPDPEYSPSIFTMRLQSSVREFRGNTFKNEKARVELQYAGVHSLIIANCDFGTNELNDIKLKIRNERGVFPHNVVLTNIPKRRHRTVSIAAFVVPIVLLSLCTGGVAIVIYVMFYATFRRSVRETFDSYSSMDFSEID